MSAGISTFDQYARGAWQRFVDDPARARASVDALSEVKRVGLTIKSRVPDANYLTPSFLILKANAVSSQRA